jgi:hypothetical protein
LGFYYLKHQKKQIKNKPVSNNLKVPKLIGCQYFISSSQIYFSAGVERFDGVDSVFADVERLLVLFGVERFDEVERLPVFFGI